MNFAKIIIGLGNTGNEWVDTRHNTGFMFIDKIAKEYGVLAKNFECYGSTRVISIDGKICLFVKPHTLMNSSGKCVNSILEKYCVNRDKLLIVYDDMDLPLGSVRFKEKGRSGGHNGIQDILDTLETDNVSRIKIGIGRPDEKSNLSEFLLTKFEESEKNELNKSFIEAKDILKELLSEIRLTPIQSYF